MAELTRGIHDLLSPVASSVGGNDTGSSESNTIVNVLTSLTLEATDSGTTYTCTGTESGAAITLPAIEDGLRFTFVITNAEGFVIFADGSDIMRDDDEDSVVGGVLYSTAVGATLQLFSVNGIWHVMYKNGAWSIGTL